MTLATLTNSDFISPSAEDAQLAAESVRGIMPLLRSENSTLKITISDIDGDTHITVPKVALRAFSQMLSAMASGSPFTLVPIHAILSTKQAADILNVSRPFFIGLLDKNEIPHHMVGTHRRVKFSDLRDYQERTSKKQVELLNEIANISQDIDENGYEL